MNNLDRRKIHYGEAKRQSEVVNEQLLALCDRESTAKQRRAITQATLVIGKAVRHVGKVMGL